MGRRLEHPDHSVITARREPWLLLLPSLLLLVIGFVAPVVGMLVSSVAGPDGGLSLDNFGRLLSSAYYLEAAARSLRLSLIQTVITIVLALPIAYVMARVSSRLRTAMLVVMILPLMTSVVVRTFGWVVLMGPNGLLSGLPLVSTPGSGSQGLLGTETGIVIAMVQVLLPYAVLTVLGVVSGIGQQLEEAARTLGANFWRTLRHVVLPLALPGVAAGATLVFALSVSSFITPKLIGGAQLPVLAATIYTDATTNLDWPFAGAQAVLLFAGVILVIASTARIGRGRS